MAIAINVLAARLVDANNKLAWLPLNKRIQHENDESLYITPKALVLANGKVYIKGGEYSGCRVYPVDADKMAQGKTHDYTCVFEGTPTYNAEMGGCTVTEESILTARHLSKLPEAIDTNDLTLVSDALATLMHLCVAFDKK